jgi:hypothetical protein
MVGHVVIKYLLHLLINLREGGVEGKDKIPDVNAYIIRGNY